MGQQIDLIVGLGNPGPEHQRTRHNAGFWFVDQLAATHRGNFRFENRLHGDIADISLCGGRTRLLKPQTYMNESGRSVLAMASYYKIPPEQILIAYDDLDLELGRAQLKFDGGHGGHNGIRDVVQNIGKAFWRLRLGVGHPGQGRKDKVLSHLLRPASSSDEDEILDAIDVAIEVLPVFIEKSPERAKTQLHSRGVEPRAYKRNESADSGES
ncbi:MAG: aminoacyl-tRNA hydrolase [Candidatus Rariloculaceae bacterium]